MIQHQQLARFAVYLLHYPCTEQGCRHYVGSTTTGRLAARMREHASGRGAKDTTALTAKAHPFALARVWDEPDRSLEQTLLTLGPTVSKLCSVCNGAMPISVHRPTKRAAGLLPPLSLDQSLIALETAPWQEPPPPEKRSGAEAAAPLPLGVQP
jgi:predicted GIY-YIG superfamily endonuclease